MNLGSNVEPDLLTVEELAVKLRMKNSWVYTHADELGALRLGKYLRFSWERVLEHLERKALLGPEDDEQVSN
jgi:excisionase family DNA binding protein